MDGSSLAHCRWECQYHIVFIPKYRKKKMHGVVRDDVREIIRTLCKYKKSHFICFAQSSRVRCSCASAIRHPLSGSVNIKILAVPFRMYSLSSYSIRPSADRRLFLAFANNCTGFSSMQITGKASSYGLA